MTKKILTFLALLSTVSIVALSCQSVTGENSDTDKTVTITFNVNGGNETAPEKISVSAGATVKLPSLKATNFLYWNTKANGNGDSYQKNGSYRFTDSVTLYAIYREIDETTYTVTLYTRDGIVLHTLSVPAGQTIPQNELSQFIDDSFIGWYDMYGNSFELSTKITGNIALYAYYQEESGGEDPDPGWSNVVSFPDEGYEIDKTAVRIEVPEGVTNIRNHAFEGCENLQEVVLPSTLEFIGDYAFAGCTSLTSIEIPENTYFIGDLHGHVFEKSGVSSITILSKDAHLRDSLFNECENLVEVTFPDDAYITGRLSFYNCPKLTSIIVPEGITDVGATTCESLAEVKLSSTVEGIYFYECAIEELDIPEGLKDIRNLSQCEKLRKITLPKSVKKIKCGVFNFTDIAEVHYAGDVGDWCNIEFGQPSSHPFVRDLSHNVDTTDIKLYLNGTLAEDIIIPDGIENIPNYAFLHCGCIKSVTIPDSVTRIGVEAFVGCCNITSLSIPKSVTKIGSAAFGGCGLKKVSLHKNISSFWNRYNLEKDIYEDVDIDEGSGSVFCCPDEVYFEGDIADWFNSFEHLCQVNYREWSSLYLNGVLAEDIVVPDGVTHIPSQVFLRYKGIKSIEISSSVKVIEKEAFRDCPNLTNVTLNEGLESIGDGAFFCCTSLESIVIPNSVTRIESCYHFWIPHGTFGGSGLVSVVVGDGLSEIEESLFMRCENLVSVKLGKNVKRIEKEVFDECKALKEVIIPDSCEFIGGSAFMECISLEEITLPKSLKTISAGLFYGCGHLKRLDIPEGVTKIEWGALGTMDWYEPTHYRAGVLEEVVFPASLEHIESGGLCVPCEDYSFTFLGNEPPIIDGSYYMDGYLPAALYVPDEALEAYRTSELKFWKHIANDEWAPPLLPLSQKPSAPD